MASTYTTNLQLEKVADNEQENTWGTTLRANWDLQDRAIAGIGTLTSSTGTNTVSDTNFQYAVLELSGSAVADIIHLMPARAKTWWIYDQHTHGTHTIQIQPTSGTAVTIPSGYDGWVRSDGTTAFLPDQFIRGTAADDVNFADKALQRPEIRDYAETVVTSTHTTSAGTATFDIENGNVFDLTLSAAGTNTLAFANWPASGTHGSIVAYVRQDSSGSRLLTYPSAVKWADGNVPTLSTASAAVDRLAFTSVDGGSTIYAAIGGQAFA